MSGNPVIFALRAGSGLRTTDAAPDHGADYLRKRHASEGPRRRSRRAELPAALRDLSDAELDDRNARIWATVQRACQVAAGVEPDAYPRLYSGSASGQAYRDAQRAALRICAREYGIPAARLAEIAETSAPWVGSVLRQADPRADRIAAQWAQAGGPGEVDGVDLVPVLVSREAADAARAFAHDGDTSAVISAAILAATCSREHRSYWSDAEIAALRRLVAAGVGDAACGRLLGRTPKAVERQRERRGL